MSHRIEQINELIRHELTSLLLTEVEFPRDSLATVTFVEVSSDLRHAKVGVSVLPLNRAGNVLTALRRSLGRIQFLLNKKLSLKPLPRLSFVIDDTEARAAEVEAVLKEVRPELESLDDATQPSA